MQRCLLAVLTMLALSSNAFAHGLDLNINNDAVRVTGEFDLSNNLVVDGNWFHHQDRGDVFGAGLHLTGAATGGRNPVVAGLGGRLLRIDSDAKGRDSGQAIPIGGFVRYTIPDYDRFVVGGSIYYAPDVMSFSDVTKYWEYNAWAGYSVLREGQIYLGLRSIRAHFDASPNVYFDTGMHLGLRLKF